MASLNTSSFDVSPPSSSYKSILSWQTGIVRLFVSHSISNGYISSIGRTNSIVLPPRSVRRRVAPLTSPSLLCLSSLTYPNLQNARAPSSLTWTTSLFHSEIKSSNFNIEYSLHYAQVELMNDKNLKN